MAPPAPEAFRRRLVDALAARRPQPPPADLAGTRAAVLIPIYPAPEPTLIFTLRTENLSSHRGQISFPGGSVDPSDPSPTHAALRETEEELGIPPGEVEIVGELDTTPTFVSGFVISPFVGWLAHAPVLRPNPAEVAEVIHVPLRALDERSRRDPGYEHDGRTYPTEAWVFEGRVIWGLTARLVRLLLVTLADAGLAAPPPPVDPWYPEGRA